MRCERMSTIRLLDIIQFIRVRTVHDSLRTLCAVQNLGTRAASRHEMPLPHNGSSTTPSALVVLLLGVARWCIDHHLVAIKAGLRVILWCQQVGLLALSLAAAGPDSIAISLGA